MKKKTKKLKKEVLKLKDSVTTLFTIIAKLNHEFNKLENEDKFNSLINKYVTLEGRINKLQKDFETHENTQRGVHGK